MQITKEWSRVQRTLTTCAQVLQLQWAPSRPHNSGTSCQQGDRIQITCRNESRTTSIRETVTTEVPSIISSVSRFDYQSIQEYTVQDWLLSRKKHSSMMIWNGVWAGYINLSTASQSWPASSSDPEGCQQQLDYSCNYLLLSSNSQI